MEELQYETNTIKSGVCVTKCWYTKRRFHNVSQRNARDESRAVERDIVDTVVSLHLDCRQSGGLLLAHIVISLHDIVCNLIKQRATLSNASFCLQQCAHVLTEIQRLNIVYVTNRDREKRKPPAIRKLLQGDDPVHENIPFGDHIYFTKDTEKNSRVIIPLSPGKSRSERTYSIFERI